MTIIWKLLTTMVVNFFPLVCESFGVWTPFALSTLSTIANRSTVTSGIPRQLARKQLVQRLRQLLSGDIMPK